MQLDKNLEKKIRENHYYFNELDSDIKENKDFLLYLLTLNPNIYFLIDETLSKNLEIITKVCFIKPDIIKNFNEDILLDKKISKKLFTINPLAKDIYEELGIIGKVNISSLPKHIFDYLVRLEKEDYEK